jgi:hypothetical protein
MRDEGKIEKKREEKSTRRRERNVKGRESPNGQISSSSRKERKAVRIPQQERLRNQNGE